MSYATEEPLSAIVAEMREHTADKAADMYYDEKSWKRLCDRIEESSLQFVAKMNSLICHLVDARVRQNQALTDAERVEREMDDLCNAFTGK